MKHYLDVCDIDGAKVQPVDLITFGSPCQSLSVAGLREGLRHESLGDKETTRSGLFMEAVRIIKEMRCATNGQYPKYAVWENVPGAFSSSKGEDFRIVLESLARVVDETVSIPLPPKGKWTNSGCVEGDDWSISWRVLYAQWAVPQRRRRIYLVSSFGDRRASQEILFVEKGLRGYHPQSKHQRKATSADSSDCSGKHDRERESYCIGNGQVNDAVNTCKEICRSLNCLDDPMKVLTFGISPYDSNAMKSSNPHSGIAVVEKSYCIGNGQADIHNHITKEISQTINCMHDQLAGVQPVALENHPNDSRVTLDESGTVQTMTSRMGTGGGQCPSGDDWRERVGCDPYNASVTGDVMSTLGIHCGLPTGRSGVIETGEEYESIHAKD